MWVAQRARPAIARWWQHLHAAPANLDGIAWPSRKFTPHLAIDLFGDRVDATELLIVNPPALLLDSGAGFERVLQLAEAANVRVLGRPRFPEPDRRTLPIRIVEARLAAGFGRSSLEPTLGFEPRTCCLRSPSYDT